MAAEKSGRAIMEMMAPDYGQVVARALCAAVAPHLDQIATCAAERDERGVRQAVHECYDAIYVTSRRLLEHMTKSLDELNLAAAEIKLAELGGVFIPVPKRGNIG